MCELGFLVVVSIKTKQQNHMNDMELQLNSIEPDIFALLSGNKQFYLSH